MKYAIEIPPAGSIILIEGVRYYVQDEGSPALVMQLNPNGTFGDNGVVSWTEALYTVVRWGPGEIIKEDTTT